MISPPYGVQRLKVHGCASRTQDVNGLLLDAVVDWIDRPAFGGDGSRLGRVSAVLVDAERRPQFVEVRTRGLRKQTVRFAIADVESLDRSVVCGVQRSPERIRVPQSRMPRARRRGDCV